MIFLADLTVKVNAGFAPNMTAVTPARSAPMRVTLRSPEIGPEAGFTAVTLGGGRTVLVISRRTLFPLSATRRRPEGPMLSPAGPLSAAEVASPPFPEYPALPLPAMV